MKLFVISELRAQIQYEQSERGQREKREAEEAAAAAAAGNDAYQVVKQENSQAQHSVGNPEGYKGKKAKKHARSFSGDHGPYGPYVPVEPYEDTSATYHADTYVPNAPQKAPKQYKPKGNKKRKYDYYEEPVTQPEPDSLESSLGEIVSLLQKVQGSR